MPPQGNPCRGDAVLIAIFFAALVLHVAAVTHHWTAPYLAGHEFRQAQTAITTYYIDEQDNFSLLYETPILGKPWVSILMEVPLYEWAVVIASRLTGLPHLLAARSISAASFYLALPAIYLLLARLGLARPRRLLVLALILTCPVYIYYTRAFLMDSMALMFSAWFLLGFVRTMEGRSWSWLAVTVLSGTAAALIKSAVFATWLIPAAAYGAWLLWRDVRTGTSWVTPAKTFAWGVATVVVALGSLRWWVAYTDPLKAAHDSAWIFTAKTLTQGNWGLFDFKAVASARLWGHLLGCWDQAIMSRWWLGILLVAGVVFRSSRRATLALGGVFVLAQLMFPFAYAYQDYYFYACAMFANAAVGFLLLALWDSKLPRWAGVLACLVPFAAQLTAYGRGYWVVQHTHTQPGYPVMEALRELTPRNSVLVVAGADWAAMTPYYAQRKALMVRNGLEHDTTYLERAFGRLADEDVSAVVLYADVRSHRNFLDYAARHFGLDLAAPTFSSPYADVYVARPYRKSVQLRLRASQRYPQLAIPRTAADDLPMTGKLGISPEVGGEAFYNVMPAPFAAEFQFGLEWIEQGDRAAILAHPNADLWLKPPPDAKTIRWGFGVVAGAWQKADARTTGVEFIVEGERPDGSRRRVYYRVLDPFATVADRGDQLAFVPYVPEPDEVLHFATRPNGDPAFDWAYWTGIEVR